jgi:hypothetical protein
MAGHYKEVLGRTNRLLYFDTNGAENEKIREIQKTVRQQDDRISLLLFYKITEDVQADRDKGHLTSHVCYFSLLSLFKK